MNYCIFSGYIEQKYAFSKQEDGTYRFDFFVSVENDDGIARPIPFRALGNSAIELYSKLQVGYYVEITCKYLRLNNVTNYFVVKDVMYKAPKTSTQYYVKASEILDMYNPKNVLERVKKNEDGK